jgi:hypothetical protein
MDYSDRKKNVQWLNYPALSAVKKTSVSITSDDWMVEGSFET